MTTNSLAAIDGMEPGDGVARVPACELRWVPQRWRYQTEMAAEIERHWHRQLAGRPQMFNGVVHLLTGGVVDRETFSGELLATDFKSYLHWRDHGFSPCGRA